MTDFYLERANTEEFLEYLTQEASGEDVRSKLILVLERKLGRAVEPLSTGTANIDRMERFFDEVLEVQPLPPVPYTAEELVPFADRAVELLMEEANDALMDEEGEDMFDLYSADATDYRTLAEYLRMGDLGVAKEFHAGRDTAARHWLFTAGADEERYYVEEPIAVPTRRVMPTVMAGDDIIGVAPMKAPGPEIFAMARAQRDKK